MRSRLTDLLTLSVVPRWAIVPHLRAQSVSDHTFRVLIIVWELADRLGVEMSADAFKYVLAHDGAESRSGDIPTPFKRHVELELAEKAACPWTTEVIPLTGGVAGVIAAADLIEALTFIRMWGIGHHSQEVAASLYADLCKLCAESCIDMGIVNTVIGHIMGD